jgi:hypothetical protein
MREITITQVLEGPYYLRCFYLMEILLQRPLSHLLLFILVVHNILSFRLYQ